ATPAPRGCGPAGGRDRRPARRPGRRPRAPGRRDPPAAPGGTGRARREGSPPGGGEEAFMASALRRVSRLGKRIVTTVLSEGPSGLAARTRRVTRRLLDAIDPPPTPADWTPTRKWFERFRPDGEQLAYYSIARWPADAPR